MADGLPPVEGHGVQARLAGIPVWGIAVGLAGIVILFVVVKNRGKKAAPVTDTVNPFVDTGSQDPNSTAYGLPGGPIGQYLGSNPTNPAYPVGLTAQGLPGPVTNQQWARLAFDWITGKGSDPTLVENALAKYLAGVSLTPQENAIRNLAEQTFGAPPEGLQVVNVIPTPENLNPSPTPTPIPPAQTPSEQIYTFKSGDTLWSVAARYGMTPDQLYNFGTNAASLEQYAHEKGFDSSNNGSRIWPGYQIGVPVR